MISERENFGLGKDQVGDTRVYCWTRGPRPDYMVDLKNKIHPIFHPTKLAGIYQIYYDADDRLLIH
ncbi:hypothetical protein AC578_6566 [Pseudocercospora eumusae]|uniref:Uncharacterized protein n=1 Tax=Pseudocercospora eumusae TaxID=321146 RepID=A0A139HHZ2_9PEZI|nr:hypothetical protein AC578_6566 [Pseudocercospora eumusae]